MDDSMNRPPHSQVVSHLQVESPALTTLEERITHVTSSDELASLVQLRGEIIRQDEFRLANQALRDEFTAEQVYARKRDSREHWFKLLGSPLVLLAGTALLIAGYSGIAIFLLLGTGLYNLAPRFFELWFRRKGDSHERE